MGKNYCNVEKKWCKFCTHDTCIWNDSEIELRDIHRCPKRESTRTVRLKDYIQDANLEPIMQAMCQYWPDQRKNEEGYREVLSKLKNMVATKTDWFIRVRQVHEPEREAYGGIIEEQNYLIISGISPGNRCYAISFAPWKEWLGMNIEQNTLDKLSKDEILAGILYEMTWYGFDEGDAQGAEEKLINSLEELKKDSQK